MILCITIFQVIAHIINEDSIRILEYFTIWGWLLTVTTVIMSQFLNPTYTARGYFRSKNSCFLAWKWFTILFQFSLIMEIIITPVFWILLWGYVKDEPKFEPFWKKTALILDHCMPLIILLFEFVFVNAIAFSRRHLLLLILLSFIYLLVNMSVTLNTGRPPYPFMNWKGFYGFVLVPGGILLYAVIMYFLVEQVTFWKLKKLDQTEIIATMKG